MMGIVKLWKAARLTLLSASVLIVLMSLAAWFRLPWPRNSNEILLGQPRATIGWFQGNRSVALVVDARGTALERNPWPFSIGPQPDKSGWVAMLRDHNTFFSCG